ncbi:Putative head protein [Pedobacter cryoconitis]|uniref:Putative head protein n=1 Tax=Pedobacter cryoconitis TaxID=188932 RepID=A0A127VHY1_9SPHI|nr:major capsid protein [Pedobacter cryoconitis]AMQ00936.1 Putative head protein [Pedobacter cryoconitis]
MINVQELVPAFRQADAQAYIQTFPFDILPYQSVFPLLYQPDLRWSGIEAEFGAKVMADVVAFNSRAPRKGRNLPTKISGDIPKIEIARDKMETDFNTLRSLENAVRLLPDGPTKKQAMQRILDWHYEDQTFAVDGVNARLEWIAKQIASKGKYSLTLINNEAGVQTKIDVDFGIPADQLVNAAKDWSAADADPIADIRTRKKAAKAKNRVLQYMTMEEDTFENFAANEKVQKFCATYVVNALNLQQLPDLDTVNLALKRQKLPIIKIWESAMVQEGKDGSQTQITGWEEGNVTFHELPTLGNTQYTTSADEYVNAGVAQKTKSGIVLLKTWGEEDPITVITKAVAYATPVLNNSKNIHILKTKLAA